MASAHVNSIDALRNFRVCLLGFAETAGEAMVGLDLELRRGLQWILEDQPLFWKNEIRRLEDAVHEARQELNHCRSLALPGDVAPCSEQKHALERAISRLRHAQEKAKITKHWGQRVDHESREWQGRANQFLNLVEGDLPKAIAMLDRLIASLEAYAAPGQSSAEPQTPPSSTN